MPGFDQRLLPPAPAAYPPSQMDATCNDIGGRGSTKHLIKETPNGAILLLSIPISFSLIFCFNSILHGIFLFYFIYTRRIPEWLFLENAVSRIPVCVSPSFRPRVCAF